MKRPVFIASFFAVVIVLLLGGGGSFFARPGAAAASETVVLPPREYKTAPADLPSFFVEQRPGDLGEGYLFVSVFNPRGGRKSYHLILDDNGEPVYYQPLETVRSSTDFKKQPNGLLTYFSAEEGNIAYVALNNQYQKVREIRAVDDPQNGTVYRADNHGLQLLDNGHALFMIYDTRVMDLSGLVPGGNPQANVIGCVIQEVDADNNLVFQWRSWDHIPITDTQMPLDGAWLSYIHCNSVDVDSDGHLLVSNRNLHEVTKIARPGGEILWRMGGKHNEFTFLNDDGFTIQHDARRLANGHLTLYDNADPQAGRNSRGVEYQVDEVNKTVQKVADYRNTPETYGQFMGNMQRLPNGNTLIGWGTSFEPLFTEFDDNGSKLLEFVAEERLFTYRAFRFPWQGYPTWPPDLAALVDGDTAQLYFSWNGSTETAAYYVEGGKNAQDLTTLALVSKTGFETTYAYEMPADGFWFFRVRPVSEEGEIGPASSVVMVLANGEPTYLPLVGGG